MFNFNSKHVPKHESKHKAHCGELNKLNGGGIICNASNCIEPFNQAAVGIQVGRWVRKTIKAFV